MTSGVPAHVRDFVQDSLRRKIAHGRVIETFKASTPGKSSSQIDPNPSGHFSGYRVNRDLRKAAGWPFWILPSQYRLVWTKLWPHSSEYQALPRVFRLLHRFDGGPMFAQRFALLAAALLLLS